jgi:hypothetical protein
MISWAGCSCLGARNDGHPSVTSIATTQVAAWGTTACCGGVSTRTPEAIMRDRFMIPILALAVAACGGLQSAPTAPDPQSPVLAVTAPQWCPTAVTVVVTDEAGLQAALAAAAPGAVIGIRGTITLIAPAVIGTPDLTLTCADRGAGLAADPSFAGDYLIDVYAPRVSVDHLVLDGRIAWGGLLPCGEQRSGSVRGGAVHRQRRVL